MNYHPTGGLIEVINETICMVPMPCDQLDNLRSFAQNVLITQIEVFIIGLLIGIVLTERYSIVGAILEIFKKK
jgi:hypothetical protein